MKLALSLVLLAPSAAAADPPWSWTGFYLGAHTGALVGTASFTDPNGPPLYGGAVTAPGFLAGLQLGYNWQLAPRWLVGLQADASVASAEGGNNTCLQSNLTAVGSDCQVKPRELATLTGRLGFLADPQGRTLLYGKGGLAWMHADAAINPGNSLLVPGLRGGDPVRRSLSLLGWTAGAGVEYALSPAWSLGLEYDYLRFAGGMPTPNTLDLPPSNNFSVLPGGATSNLAIDLHSARIGLNYRWGVAAKPSEPAAPEPAAAWAAGWEFEGGLRYLYSVGKYQSGLGTAVPDALISRLTYDGMTSHSGEIFGRLDSPFNVFVKGLFGGGYLTRGTMNDEDWIPGETIIYSNTLHQLAGSFNYLTADIGYNILRGPDHKVGLFVGYNRYLQAMDAKGCSQLADIDGACSVDANRPVISDTSIWHSLRVGTSAEVEIWDRVRVGGDIAYLPLVTVQELDTHHLRGIYFPAQGKGHGVQLEVILSYRLTDSFNVGIGGRYWAMWTTSGYQVESPTISTPQNTERYGVFLQASYKFGTP